MKRAIALAVVTVIFGAVVFLREWPVSLYMHFSPPEPETSLAERLAVVGRTQGDAVFLRIFKEEADLEVWLSDGEIFHLFQSYPICRWSGELGPKLQEGDHQAPEGFYTVVRDSLNPNSKYHLSFNLGFPNEFDRSLDRTGSFLMVHGGCVSVGCYAMTDPGIEEIYGLVEAALEQGQPAVQVHALPFRMSDDNVARYAESPWIGFWHNLKEGYDAFEETRRPPVVEAVDGVYFVSQG